MLLLSAPATAIDFTTPQTENAKTSDMLVRIETLLLTRATKMSNFCGRPAMAGRMEHLRVAVSRRR
jgi:hypothetical protein